MQATPDQMRLAQIYSDGTNEDTTREMIRQVKSRFFEPIFYQGSQLTLTNKWRHLKEIIFCETGAKTPEGLQVLSSQVTKPYKWLGLSLIIFENWSVNK